MKIILETARLQLRLMEESDYEGICIIHYRPALKNILSALKVNWCR